MADPITAIAILAGAAQGGKAFMQSQAAEAAEKALELKAKQNQVNYQQKTLSNLDMLDKITASQIAQATVRGFTLDSPSFNAIQRNTFNVASREQKNLDVEKSILDQNTDIEKDNVRRTLYAQLFGDVTELASTYGNIYSKLPKLE